MEAPECSPPEELHDRLVEMFVGHGIAAEIQGHWVTFPGYPSKVQGLIFERKGMHPHSSTQVDIRFSPWPGCLIGESFAGVAADREARVDQALGAFAMNTLHVLLRAFFDADVGEQANEWEVVNRGVTRTVTDGNVLTRATSPGAPGDGWVEGFRRIFSDRPLDEGTHWVRLYFAQVDGRRAALELLLDNEPWLDALEEAQSLAWPLGEGFSSIRMFLVVQGGLDVGRAIGILARHGEAKEEHLQELLVAAGCPESDAKRIILLAPIAFGGRLLETMGVVSPTVCTLDDGKSRWEIDLESSPIFRESRRIASDVWANGSMSREEIIAIVGRDSTVAAVNAALNAGSDPKDLKTSTLVIFWDEAAPFCPTLEIEPAPASEPLEPAPVSKPWWRFWSP